VAGGVPEVFVPTSPGAPAPALGKATLVVSGRAGDVRTPVQVVGTFEDDASLYAGRLAILASPELVEQVVEQGRGEGAGAIAYDSAYVEASSVGSVLALERSIRELGFEASSVVGAEPTLPEGLAVLGQATGWVAVLVIGTALAAGAVVGAGFRADRSREVGVLRAVGWTVGRVVRVHLVEVAAVTLLAAVSAVVAAQILCWFALPLLPSTARSSMGPPHCACWSACRRVGRWVRRRPSERSPSCHPTRRCGRCADLGRHDLNRPAAACRAGRSRR
jgi:hypothetical protein